MKLLRFAKKRGCHICVQQDEGNATLIAEALEGKENEDSHEDTERLLRLLQEMNEINTEATHNDEDTPQDMEQLLEEISAILKKNEPDTSKYACAERNEGVSARKRKLGCGVLRATLYVLKIKECPSGRI